VSYCSTCFILEIYLWIWSDRLLDSTFVVRTCFYVLLNKPMVMVDALAHTGVRQGKRFIWGHGKASVSFLFVWLWKLYVFQFRLLLSSISEKNACKNSFPQSKSLTIWRKCLIFSNNGFTVLSSNRNLKIKIDSYPEIQNTKYSH